MGGRGSARAGAATIVVVLAVAGAGCGANSRLSKSAYEKKLQQEGQGISDTFTKLNTSLGSFQALAKRIGQGQNELRKVADELGSLKPPREVERDNRELAKGLRALARDLEDLKIGAAKGDAKLVQQASQKLQQSTALKDAQAATKDIKSKGYKIGAITG